jgi:hypothetical protein
MAASNQSETNLQQSVVAYIRANHPDVMVMHIPNHRGHTENETFHLYRMGQVKGAPDLQFIVPHFGTPVYTFVELKTAKGKQSPAQKKFQKWCMDYGARYFVCRSIPQVIDALNLPQPVQRSQYTRKRRARKCQNGS